MEKLYFFDETFYWGRSGRRATAIEVECELTQSVNPDVLRTGKKDSANNTYGISYAGHLDFGDDIAQQVKTVSVSAGSYSYPLWIIACEYKGIIRMRLVQAFESDRLATVIHQELSALFPGTTYTDRGYHDFDSFPLSSVPHKRI